MLGRMLGDARGRSEFRSCRRGDFGRVGEWRNEVWLLADRVRLRHFLQPLLFAQFQILSDAGADTTEGRDQKPEPPDMAGGRKISGCERNEYESDAGEKTARSAVDTRRSMISAVPSSQVPTVSCMDPNCHMAGHLAFQRLRDQAHIGSA